MPQASLPIGAISPATALRPIGGPADQSSGNAVLDLTTEAGQGESQMPSFANTLQDRLAEAKGKSKGNGSAEDQATSQDETSTPTDNALVAFPGALPFAPIQMANASDSSAAEPVSGQGAASEPFVSGQGALADGLSASARNTLLAADQGRQIATAESGHATASTPYGASGEALLQGQASATSSAGNQTSAGFAAQSRLQAGLAATTENLAATGGKLPVQAEILPPGNAPVAARNRQTPASAIGLASSGTEQSQLAVADSLVSHVAASARGQGLLAPSPAADAASATPLPALAADDRHLFNSSNDLAAKQATRAMQAGDPSTASQAQAGAATVTTREGAPATPKPLPAGQPDPAALAAAARNMASHGAHGGFSHGNVEPKATITSTETLAQGAATAPGRAPGMNAAANAIAGHPEAGLNAEAAHKTPALDVNLTPADTVPANFATTLTAHTSVVQTREAPPPVPVHTPFGAPNWPDEIGKNAIWLTGQNQQKAELVLTPPHLGRIEISVTVENNQATANFVSPSPAVREALEQALPRLAEMFANAGIQLGQANVGSESAASKNRDNSSAGRRGGRAEALPTTVSASSTTGLRSRNGLVDTFA